MQVASACWCPEAESRFAFNRAWWPWRPRARWTRRSGQQRRNDAGEDTCAACCCRAALLRAQLALVTAWQLDAAAYTARALAGRKRTRIYLVRRLMGEIICEGRACGGVVGKARNFGSLAWMLDITVRAVNRARWPTCKHHVVYVAMPGERQTPERSLPRALLAPVAPTTQHSRCELCATPSPGCCSLHGMPRLRASVRC